LIFTNKPRNSFLPQKHLKTSQKKLLKWYETNGRQDLPWRNTEDVYAIYVSEIMLQQTQVKRVAEEYYFQFLEKFPSLLALSQAPLEEVFGMWSGLGYYRRAKNLHASAILCSDRLPKDMKSLQHLPGIGKYTASAICSFGYHQKVSVVDTNIARVLARFFGVEDAKEAQLWELADSFLNTKNPTEHNLALMDLGSLVCLPKIPTCAVSASEEVLLGCQLSESEEHLSGCQVCPLFENCKGKEEPSKYYKTKSKVYEEKKLHYGVCVKDGTIAMKISKEGMYKDMLEPPSIETFCHVESLLGSFKHSVTKYRLDVHLYHLDALEEEVVWMPLSELHTAPISSLTQKALKLYKEVKRD